MRRWLDGGPGVCLKKEPTATLKKTGAACKVLNNKHPVLIRAINDLGIGRKSRVRLHWGGPVRIPRKPRIQQKGSKDLKSSGGSKSGPPQDDSLETRWMLKRKGSEKTVRKATWSHA